MDIYVETWIRRDRIGLRQQVTEGTFTFVAIDDGKPAPIPDIDDVLDICR